jgi:ribosomal protein S18 acetylase RimI-like enzyme
MSYASRKHPATVDLEIREMEVDDLATVFHLGEQLFTAAKWPNLYRSWDVYDLLSLFASDGEFCLVAELDGRIVGFALGCFLEKRRNAWRYGYLEWLGVDPSMKGNGIGRRLLSRLTDIFIDNGARIMLVDTEMENIDAIRFFKNQGFGNDVPHVYMSRNLTTHPGYLKKKARSERTASATRQARKPTQLNGPDIRAMPLEEEA